jgi:multidrug resistance efflux pump
MSDLDLRPKHLARAGDAGAAPGRAERHSRFRLPPVLITLAVVALALWLGRATWLAYMVSPWTRDGVVRAYVVSVAPQVGGQIVRLPVVDNQLVHEGDELFEIDPSDYRIALTQTRAQLQRDEAALEYQRETRRRQATLTSKGVVTADTFERVTSALHEAEAAVDADRAAVDKAQLNLSRTEVRSPVNGYVTNLLARLGDYAMVGQSRIAVVDADSYWIDGYFEETALAHIAPGDKATAKLMAYKPPVRGHVDSIARGIDIPNAQPDQTGLASVNPIFTWVRLAQRVPVRIHIDEVPTGVRLIAGMTATVQIEGAR